MEYRKQFIGMLDELYKHEQERLRLYGQDCSMGKCAQSRIHLMDSIISKINKDSEETDKLHIFGNKLIKAKARYYRAVYSFENAIAYSDIDIRKEHRLISTVRMTETEIKNETISHTQNERNELKLSQIALAKAELNYEMEKLRLQCEVVKS